MIKIVPTNRYDVSTKIDNGRGPVKTTLTQISGDTLTGWVANGSINYNGLNTAAPLLGIKLVTPITPQMVTMNGLFGCD